MLVDFHITEVIPHSGKMCLLDRVIVYGNDWLKAEVTITPSSMFVEDEGVPALVGLEYLAQTVAAYSGVIARNTLSNGPKIGFLLGTRKYECSAAYFKIGQTLETSVEKEIQTEDGIYLFRCYLSGEGVKASTSLIVFQPKNIYDFVEQNMVS